MLSQCACVCVCLQVSHLLLSVCLNWSGLACARYSSCSLVTVRPQTNLSPPPKKPRQNPPLDSPTPKTQHVSKVDLTKFSSLLEHRRGATATVRSPDGAHALALEMGLRDITPRRHPGVPYAHAASLPVVADARPSVKSSVKYTFTDDSRNDTFVPSLGSFFRASVEGAGEERMVWDPGGWGGRMTWETSGVSSMFVLREVGAGGITSVIRLSTANKHNSYLSPCHAVATVIIY